MSKSNEDKKIDHSAIIVIDHVKIIDKDTRAILINKRDQIKKVNDRRLQATAWKQGYQPYPSHKSKSR